MTSTDDQYVERARQVGLFRYGLIREAADPALSIRQRGRLVGEIAAGEHVGPFGAPVRVSRPTVDRWIRIWRAGGFDALVPPPRRVAARTPAEVLALAVALKREAPARTATQVRAVLLASSGWAPHERTVQRHFVRLGLATRPDGRAPEAFGRFEAAEVNDLWTGDALHGPHIGGREAILFAFIDDHTAPRGASLYPRQSREELGGRFLGPRAYLDPKGEGNNSMPEKQRSCSRAEATRCGTRVIWPKLDCLNPNLQETQVDVRRKSARSRRHIVCRQTVMADTTSEMWSDAL